MLKPQYRRLDPRVQGRIQRMLGDRPGKVRWGTFRRTEPFDETGGWSRGLPIDRALVERFLRDHAADIQGSVLEVGRAPLAAKIGGSAVRSVDVFDDDPHNARATIVADPCEAGSLPYGEFNCCVIPDGLERWRRPDIALNSLWEPLLPGGVLLLAVRSIGCPLGWNRGGDPDQWRWTSQGLTELLIQTLGPVHASTQAFGNLTTAVASQFGLASRDLRSEELSMDDTRYPVIVGARVVKQ